MRLKNTDLSAANKALDACSEPFKNLSTTWSSLDKAQKIEMISQIVTEIIAGPKATKIFDKFMKFVTEETALASSRVLKGLTGEKTPANRVLKREDRPIAIKRIDYDAIEKNLSSKVSGTDKALFEKGKFKHICGIDKKLKYRASGAIEASYSGYHYDKDFSLVKKGKVKFLSEPKICPKTGLLKLKNA